MNAATTAGEALQVTCLLAANRLSAEKVAKELLPIIEKEPTLRMG
jgi:hypothetical protein